MRIVFPITYLLLSLTAVNSIRAEQMPQISGGTLARHSIEFPSATAGSVTIVFIGFSHASQSQLKAWTDRATNEFHNNPHVAIYSIAVLEDAPRFVRGMAVHGIRSGTPVAQQDHFVVVYHGESELKRVAGFQRSEDAYVLILAPKGEIKWVTHGPVTDAALRELAKQANTTCRSETHLCSV